MSDCGDSTCLFVGDLSMFCTETDLASVFSSYGKVENVKVICCEQTGKNLNYGFVRFDTVACAAKAKEEQEGKVLLGRPMRIRWASNRTPYGNEADGPYVRPKDGTVKPDTASVHVTYVSQMVESAITEETLLGVFSEHGQVMDIIIKKYEINKSEGWQRGYAFVHFLADDEGIEAALSSVRSLLDTTVNAVHFKCAVSHKLEGLLKQKGKSVDIPPDQQRQGANKHPKKPFGYSSVPFIPKAQVVSTPAMQQQPMMPSHPVVAPQMNSFCPPLLPFYYQFTPIYYYDQLGNAMYGAPRLVNSPNGAFIAFTPPAPSPTTVANFPHLSPVFPYQQQCNYVPQCNAHYFPSNASTGSDAATMMYDCELHQEQFMDYQAMPSTTTTAACLLSPSHSDDCHPGEEMSISDVDDQRLYADMSMGYSHTYAPRFTALSHQYESCSAPNGPSTAVAPKDEGLGKQTSVPSSHGANDAAHRQ